MRGASRWLDASAPIGPKPATAAAVARPMVSVPASAAFFFVTPAWLRPDRWALIVVSPFVDDALSLRCPAGGGGPPGARDGRCRRVVLPGVRPVAEMCVTDRSRRSTTRMYGGPTKCPWSRGAYFEPSSRASEPAAQ